MSTVADAGTTFLSSFGKTSFAEAFQEAGGYVGMGINAITGGISEGIGTKSGSGTSEKEVSTTLKDFLKKFGIDQDEEVNAVASSLNLTGDEGAELTFLGVSVAGYSDSGEKTTLPNNLDLEQALKEAAKDLKSSNSEISEVERDAISEYIARQSGQTSNEFTTSIRTYETLTAIYDAYTGIEGSRRRNLIERLY